MKVRIIGGLFDGTVCEPSPHSHVHSLFESTEIGERIDIFDLIYERVPDDTPVTKGNPR